MFRQKIWERVITFEQIERLAVLPGDVQSLGHVPPIFTIVCSLKKRGEIDRYKCKCQPSLCGGAKHTNIAKTW